MGDLSELSFRERLEIQADRIQALSPGSSVWLNEHEDMIVFDPGHEITEPEAGDTIEALVGIPLMVLNGEEARCLDFPAGFTQICAHP